MSTKSPGVLKTAAMAKEFERTQRVSHYLHEELARLLRIPCAIRVQDVNLTGVEVSRDLSHAKVFLPDVT